MFRFALLWKLLSPSNRQRCTAAQAGGFAQSIPVIALSLSPSAASQGITHDLGSASFPLRQGAKVPNQTSELTSPSEIVFKDAGLAAVICMSTGITEDSITAPPTSHCDSTTEEQ